MVKYNARGGGESGGGGERNTPQILSKIEG